jgi:hypothetical protein
VAAAEQAIDQALADERYDTALELAATAKKLAESPHAEARFRKEASDRIARRVREIEAIQRAAAVAIEAEATLEKSPDDPTANLTLGRWYCLYKRDWDRGLPYLAKSPDGQFKTLAKLELAVDLTLKPQLDLADGWWDIGQRESGIPRDAARLHAGDIYRLQLPNLQVGLKKTAVEQRLKDIDAIERSAAGATRQIDLLKLVDVKRDAVNGEWTLSAAGLMSDSTEKSQLEFQYQPPEEYDFEVVFTRKEGHDFVAQICASQGRKFEWIMGSAVGTVSGFQMINGQWSAQNPTKAYAGLNTNQRYTSVVKLRHDGVKAYLDGTLVADWKTNYADMSLWDGYGFRNPGTLGIATWKTPTIFHSAKVTEITGIGKVGKRQAIVSSEKSTVEPRAAAGNRFPRNRWVDVLRLVDTSKHAVNGNWSRDSTVISCGAEGEARMEVPVAVAGSYDLEVEFTRTDGDSDVTTIFTVGDRQCSLLLSMDHGGLSGIDLVDGKRPWDDGNPSVIRPGRLTNGRAYVLLISVRQTKPDRASVDVLLDGRPYLPHWEGNPASLSLHGAWQLRDSRVLGVGGWNTRIIFHSMRLKLVAGRAISLASKNGAEFNRTPDSHPAVTVKTARQGGGGGGAFDEVGPPGTRLVGFHLVDGGAINVLQPIYRGPGGAVAGVSHGGNPGTAVDVVAKDGYAVGAVVVRSGDWIDALRVVFMRVRGKRLDPSDSYESPWYGGSGGGETKLGGDGSPVVGVFGASGDFIDSIGLNLEKPATASTTPQK